MDTHPTRHASGDDDWWSGHAAARGIMIDDLKVLYVPVPKAACTSILWALAGAAGLPPESFESLKVVRVAWAENIHNMDRWPDDHRLSNRDPSEVREVLASNDWFSFTVVREPAVRLWSAWQSKILLHEPKLANRFDREPWWPEAPGSADDIVSAFRGFVSQLAVGRDDPPKDPHWWPQSSFLDLPEPGLRHIGKVELLDDTLALLADHLRRFDIEMPPMRRENTTPLPFAWGVFDEHTLEVVRTRFGADYQRFDYPVPQPGNSDLEERYTVAPSQLTALRNVIERHERMRVMDALFRQERQRLQGTVADAQGQLKEARGQLKERQQALTATSRQLDDANRRLENTLGSMSWRVTRPLRALGDLARRARSRVAAKRKDLNT